MIRLKIVILKHWYALNDLDSLLKYKSPGPRANVSDLGDQGAESNKVPSDVDAAGRGATLGDLNDNY